MSDTATEQTVLDNYLEELRSKGYDTVSEPHGHTLPSFLRGFEPDAVAVRGKEKLIIEVAGQGALSKTKLQRLRDLVAGQEGWSLQVIGLGVQTTRPFPDVAPELFETSNNNVVQLAGSEQTKPALLLAWATFEGVARAIHPKHFERPQTPGRLVEVLAGEGFLEPSQADLLRTLANQRNRIIHGGLDTPVRKDELDAFSEIIRSLIAKLDRGKQRQLG